MDYWMRTTRLTWCGSWCWYVIAVALAGAGWLARDADASSVDDFRYFPNGMCVCVLHKDPIHHFSGDVVSTRVINSSRTN